MNNITQDAGWYFDAYFKGKGLVHNFHKRRLNKLYSLVPDNEDILDCGCGSGILAYLLSRKAKSISGVDIRKECVDFCNNKIDGKFEQGDLKDLNLNKIFDVVICSDVIEHFYPEDREKVLKNLDRHVKEGGILLLAFPSSLYVALEPVWSRMRKLLYPKQKFDDEDIHLIVNANELKMKNYKVTKKGFTCLGLIFYMVLTKT